MDRENEKSASLGHGQLFDPILADELVSALGQKTLLFFYFGKQVIGFVRLIRLDQNSWELGSAISSPEYRKSHTGFNTLFQSAALMRLAKLTKYSFTRQRLFIVTYHAEVAVSIRRQLSISRTERVMCQDGRFDFSRIIEITAPFCPRILHLLRLSTRHERTLPFFIFDIGNCLDFHNERSLAPESATMTP